MSGQLTNVWYAPRRRIFSLVPDRNRTLKDKLTILSRGRDINACIVSQGISTIRELVFSDLNGAVVDA